MTLLIFGKTGQVAQELARRAPDAQFAGRETADLTDPAACAALIRNAACGQLSPTPWGREHSRPRQLAVRIAGTG